MSTPSSTTNPRVIAAFILLPLAIGLERFSYYMSRSVSYLRFESTGLDRATAMSSSYGAVLIGGVIAGVLAAAFLPRIVLVAAGVCAAAGYFIIAGSHDPEWLAWGLRFSGGGAGALKACLYGLALLVLPTTRLRVVYIAVTYGLVNGAALVAAPVGGLLASVLTPESVFVVAGVCVVVGLVPAVAFIVVDKLRAAAATGDDAATPVPPPGDPGRAVIGALVMALATVPFWAAYDVTNARMWSLGMSASVGSLVQSCSIFITLGSVGALIAWLLSRHKDAGPLAVSFLIGVCLALAVGAALIACVPVAPATILATAVFSIAELAAPLALGRALSQQHPRAVTLAAGFMLVFSAAGSEIGNAAADSAPVVVLVAAAVVCAVAGGLFIALGNRFDAWLDAPTQERRESWLNPVQGSSQSSPS